MEAALPQHDRPRAEEFIQNGAVVPAMQRRLVAPADEPFIDIRPRFNAFHQPRPIVVRGACRRRQVAIGHAPGFGRDQFHGQQDGTKEGVDVVVNQARQQHLGLEALVHRYLPP
jgi:hypothetical protein